LEVRCGFGGGKASGEAHVWWRSKDGGKFSFYLEVKKRKRRKNERMRRRKRGK
jgi:hypothetical protein